MIKLYFLVLLYCLANTYSQTDWVKWGKADLSYIKNDEFKKRDFSLSGESFSEIALKSITAAYWFIISDVDGDNCPFNPSCSNFFVQAVRETNLPQGMLMFFDRFTRDLNIFNRDNKYPRIGAVHYHDPVYLYTLNEDKIRYLPPNTFIKSE
jgi:putative component of membrane protein insertase Oxa1/YidC/SpoIIIJ protein YidD